jgi:hypothetical protein
MLLGMFVGAIVGLRGGLNSAVQWAMVGAVRLFQTISGLWNITSFVAQPYKSLPETKVLIQRRF